VSHYNRRWRNLEAPSVAEEHSAAPYGTAPVGLPADLEQDADAFPADNYTAEDDEAMRLAHERAELTRAERHVMAMSNQTLIELVQLADDCNADELKEVALAEVLRRISRLNGTAA
jgi:hypothetical protein